MRSPESVVGRHFQIKGSTGVRLEFCAKIGAHLESVSVRECPRKNYASAGSYLLPWYSTKLPPCSFSSSFAVTHEEAESSLKNWYSWAIRSQIDQVQAVAKTVKKHWNGILSWFNSKLSNGFIEAINGLIQAAKKRARGYRSTKNLINMAYLIAGKLDFGYSHETARSPINLLTFLETLIVADLLLC